MKNSKHTSAFSKQIDEQCHRISFSEIRILWIILQGATRLDFVRARFMQNALHFSEALGFLTGLGAVRVARGQACRKEVLGKTDDEMKSVLAQRLFDRNTPYGQHAHEFLGLFKNVNGGFEIVMDSEKRRQFGGIRNLLLDLEFLDQDADKPRYRISQHHLADFIEAKSTTPTNAIELQKLLRAREELGREAEVEVLKFEAARLRNRPSLARRIKHVAAENVGAGYDISSFTQSATGAAFSNRLIEVKAVSLVDFKFFWSRNEIEAARVNGVRYFLYLVPVSKRGFEMEKLKVIQNPFRRVYLDCDEWSRQDEVVSFSLKEPNGHS